MAVTLPWLFKWVSSSLWAPLAGITSISGLLGNSRSLPWCSPFCPYFSPSILQSKIYLIRNNMTFAQLRNKYLMNLLILSILIMVVYTILLTTNTPILTPVFPYIIILIAGFSLISHILLLKAASISNQKFTQAFLLSTTVKLLLYLSVMAAYAFTHRELAKIFILNFTALYFIYTPFEVIMILKQTRKLKK